VLEGPANQKAPTREVNEVLEPGGYMPRWCRRNGARASLRMLCRSAYTAEAVFGHKSQEQAGVPQLVPNQKDATRSIVGMSMAPSIWIVNFALIYTLNPSLTAKMPAWWTPIPANVAQAIAASANRAGSIQRLRVVIPRLIARPGARRSAPRSRDDLGVATSCRMANTVLPAALCAGLRPSTSRSLCLDCGGRRVARLMGSLRSATQRARGSA
jgi:hypothetical protein